MQKFLLGNTKIIFCTDVAKIGVDILDIKHVILINAVDKYFFTSLPRAKGEKNVIEKVVSSIYKGNIQIRRDENLSAFHKVDTLFLWFLNMVGLRKYLVLAGFVDNLSLEVMYQIYLDVIIVSIVHTRTSIWEIILVYLIRRYII